MPRYASPIRTNAGLLFPFQRTLYRNAKTSKQGAGKDLIRYGADGAYEFENGMLAFFSSVGLTVEETAEAFNQLESVNRSAAGNAKVVHHMIIQSLYELSPEEQWAMLLHYCEQVFGSQDLPYSVCLHPPSEGGDQRNWHAHVVFSYRPMVRTDQAKWQIGRALRSDLDCPEGWTQMRFLLAEELNHTCEKHGINKRYTHLSYAASGMDYIPQAHLGAGLTAKVRRGEEVALNEQNHAVMARNSALQCVRELRRALQASIATVSEYVRKERDAVFAAIALPPANARDSATSIAIRGVSLPSWPQALPEDGDHREDLIPANDLGPSSELDTHFTPEVVAPKTPEPLREIDGDMVVSFDLEQTPPVRVPEALWNEQVEPEIVAHAAPVLPELLFVDAIDSPTWAVPFSTPILPGAPDGDHGQIVSSVWELDSLGLTPPMTPASLEDANSTIPDQEQLPTFVPPLLPHPIEPASVELEREAVSRRLVSDGLRQITQTLGGSTLGTSDTEQTLGFDGNAGLVPEPLDSGPASDAAFNFARIATAKPLLPELIASDFPQPKSVEDFSALNFPGILKRSEVNALAAESQFADPSGRSLERSVQTYEPRFTVSRVREDEDEEEVEQAAAESNALQEQGHGPVSMLKLLPMLEQQRHLLKEVGGGRILLPQNILDRIPVGSVELAGIELQRRLAALHARNCAELKSLASHVAEFPDQLNNNQGFWELDLNAPLAIRSVMRVWRANTKVQEALEHIARIPSNQNAPATVAQRKDGFLKRTTGGPLPPAGTKRKMSSQVNLLQSGPGFGD